MEYRELGNTGLKVSAIGLGGNTFGSYCDQARTAEIVGTALDLGINHVDTSDSYSRGVSEEHVGKAIAGRRGDVVLATKTGWSVGDGANDQGLSYRRVMASCEASLRRLGTDYIDLYYLHRPDPATPLAETLRAYDDLARQGKIRYVGISNHPAWQICEALWIADRHGYRPPAVTQSRYNLIERELEAELLPFCRAHRIGIVPYSPLAGGLLTGKYRLGEPVLPGVRGYDNPLMQKMLTERNLEIAGRLAALARERDRTGGDLAVAWLLSRLEISSVIIGATSAQQVKANVAGSTFTLAAEDRQALDGLLDRFPA